MIISDVEYAKAQITTIGYYRLKAFMLPFREKDSTFKTGTTFEDVIELCNFDERLRLLVFSQIQKLETTIRNTFSEYFCEATNNPFWYLDADIFGAANSNHLETLAKVQSNFRVSKEAFAEYYRGKYINEFSAEYSEMPPSWMAMEIMSFGNVVCLLNSINDDFIKKHRLNRFSSKKMDVLKYKSVTNWLLTIRDVRNHCAHHSRLFNRNLRAPDGIQKRFSKDVPLVDMNSSRGKVANRLYTALAALQIMLTKLGYPKFGPDISQMFEEHPIAKTQMASMGFPENWTEEPLFFDAKLT